jgi:hypothetical protein
MEYFRHSLLAFDRQCGDTHAEYLGIRWCHPETPPSVIRITHPCDFETDAPRPTNYKHDESNIGLMGLTVAGGRNEQCIGVRIAQVLQIVLFPFAPIYLLRVISHNAVRAQLQSICNPGTEHSRIVFNVDSPPCFSIAECKSAAIA